MSSIELLAELDEKVHKILAGVNWAIPDSYSDEFASVVDNANQNGFGLYALTSPNPNLVFVADYHPQGKESIAKREMADFLASCLQPDDTVLFEYKFPGKILGGIRNLSGHSLSLIADKLGDLNISTIANDDTDLVDDLEKTTKLMQAVNDLKKAEELADKWCALNHRRDKNFLYGPMGILRNLSSEQRTYQIIGLAHLVDGYIGSKLKNVGHAIFVPQQETPFKKRLILSYGKNMDRRQAARALAHDTNPDTLTTLLKTSEDGSLNLRKDIAVSLGKQDHPKATKRLHQMLYDDSSKVRWAAALGLSLQTHGPAKEFIGETSKTDDREKWALSFLSINDGAYSEVKENLIQGLGHSDEYVRSLAVSNIARLDKDLFMGRLSDFLTDDSAAVRENAFMALYRAGQLSPELIEQAETDQDKHVRLIAKLVNPQSHTSLPLDPLVEQKFTGCLVGAAVGDAIGAPVESLSYKKIIDRFGRVTSFVDNKYRRGDSLDIGEWTDDTEQMLILSRAFIENGFIHPADMGSRFGDVMRNIDLGKKKERGYAVRSMLLQKQLYAGANWRFTGTDSGGCGSVMRVHPIGLFYHDDPQSVIDYAQDSAIATHCGDAAIGSTILMAYMMARAVTLEPGFDRNEFTNECVDFISPHCNELAQRIDRLREDKSIPIAKLVEIYGGNGHMATTSIALETFLRHADSYLDAVSDAINNGGDSDSIGCMVGGLCGAYLGIDQIPDDLKQGLYQRDLVEETGKELYKAFLSRS